MDLTNSNVKYVSSRKLQLNVICCHGQYVMDRKLSGQKKIEYKWAKLGILAEHLPSDVY